MPPDCSLLLVDDDDEFLEILNRRFTRRGAKTVAVDNPQAAIEAAQTARFHVAVVDRTLPGLDGVQLMETLKLQQPEIRVIMLSGHGDEQSVAERSAPECSSTWSSHVPWPIWKRPWLELVKPAPTRPPKRNFSW